MRRTAVVLGLLALPSAADAAALKGETSQGRPAAIRFNADGLVRSVSIRWRAECENGILRDRTVIDAPFDKRTRKLVEHVDVDVARDANDPYRIRTEGTLEARRESGRRWTGTFSATATVRDGERVISRCVLTPVTFEVER